MSSSLSIIMTCYWITREQLKLFAGPKNEAYIILRPPPPYNLGSPPWSKQPVAMVHVDERAWASVGFQSSKYNANSAKMMGKKKRQREESSPSESEEGVRASSPKRLKTEGERTLCKH